MEDYSKTIITIAIYVYLAFCIYRIAQTTNTENPWLAWIPIANVYLLVKIIGKSWGWFLLAFIPIVNIIVVTIIWMKISKKLGKSKYLGLLMLIPGVNLILPGYLAFSGSSQTPSTGKFRTPNKQG